MSLLRQVTLSRASRKTDKTVSINFITDLEESSEGFMEIDKLLQSRGILYYSDKGELTQAEIDEIDNVDIELEGKTLSQRLRAVLYVLWKQQGEAGDFKDFYTSFMNLRIENIKEKLD